MADAETTYYRKRLSEYVTSVQLAVSFLEGRVDEAEEVFERDGRELTFAQIRKEDPTVQAVLAKCRDLYKPALSRSELERQLTNSQLVNNRLKKLCHDACVNCQEALALLSQAEAVPELAEHYQATTTALDRTIRQVQLEWKMGRGSEEPLAEEQAVSAQVDLLKQAHQVLVEKQEALAVRQRHLEAEAARKSAALEAESRRMKQECEEKKRHLEAEAAQKSAALETEYRRKRAEWKEYIRQETDKIRIGHEQLAAAFAAARAEVLTGIKNDLAKLGQAQLEAGQLRSKVVYALERPIIKDRWRHIYLNRREANHGYWRRVVVKAVCAYAPDVAPNDVLALYDGSPRWGEPLGILLTYHAVYVKGDGAPCVQLPLAAVQNLTLNYGCLSLYADVLCGGKAIVNDLVCHGEELQDFCVLLETLCRQIWQVVSESNARNAERLLEQVKPPVPATWV